MTTHELKPCPFCGAEAKLVGSFRHWWVSCTRIGVCIANRPDTAAYSCDQQEDAIRLWNTRTNDQAISTLTAEVEELRALLTDVSGLIRVGGVTHKEMTNARSRIATLTKGEGDKP